MNRFLRSANGDPVPDTGTGPRGDSEDQRRHKLLDGQHAHSRRQEPAEMNVFQEEDTIVIERAIPAPGLDELETELVEKRLEVRAMLREDVDSDAPDHRERPVNSGSFTVMVNLPQQLERTMVNLDVEEGWLVIRMPRTGQIDRETVEVICDLE